MAFWTISKKSIVIVLSLVLAAIAVTATAATVIAASREVGEFTVVNDAGLYYGHQGERGQSVHSQIPENVFRKGRV